jgi:hypothetical protein
MGASGQQPIIEQTRKYQWCMRISLSSRKQERVNTCCCQLYQYPLDAGGSQELSEVDQEEATSFLVFGSSRVAYEQKLEVPSNILLMPQHIHGAFALQGRWSI